MSTGGSGRPHGDFRSRELSSHAILSVQFFRPIPPQLRFRLVGRFRGLQGSLQHPPAVAVPRLLDGTFLLSEEPLVVVHRTIPACLMKDGLSAIRRGGIATAGWLRTGTRTVATPAGRAGGIRPDYLRIRARPLPVELPPDPALRWSQGRPGGGPSWDRADQALYHSKHQGRNRVTHFDVMTGRRTCISSVPDRPVRPVDVSRHRTGDEMADRAVLVYKRKDEGEDSPRLPPDAEAARMGTVPRSPWPGTRHGVYREHAG